MLARDTLRLGTQFDFPRLMAWCVLGIQHPRIKHHVLGSVMAWVKYHDPHRLGNQFDLPHLETWFAIFYMSTFIWSTLPARPAPPMQWSPVTNVGPLNCGRASIEATHMSRACCVEAPPQRSDQHRHNGVMRSQSPQQRRARQHVDQFCSLALNISTAAAAGTRRGQASS